MPDGTPAVTPSWTLERVIQLVVLLIGGGIGGVIASLATSTLEWRKLTQQAEVQNATFVDKYLSEVINKDIHVRFRIAEYFGFVLESEKQRNLWKTYLDALEKNYEALSVDYFEQVKAIDPTSDELANFKAIRRLKRIENYLGEARELKIKPATQATLPQPFPPGLEDAFKSLPPAPSQKKNSEYQVFTQFAGLLQRERIRGMMQELAKSEWKMQGIAGGGERTPAAAGSNEVRYGAVEDQPAANKLAGEVQATGLPGKSVITSLAPGIRPGTLEIWISN